MVMRDVPVLALDELEDGSMRGVKAAGSDVLLVRDGDTVYAVGGKCTHYGAPLEKGVYADGVVHCPFHKACFRVSNGEVLAPPAVDGLPSFPVRIEDGQVIVTIADDAPDRVSPMPSLMAATDERTFVVVGAGAAGAYAAQRLRLDGFRGRLVLVSDEDRVPYDRTKLSKPFLAGQQDESQLPLRDAAFWDQQGIERVTGEVAGIDVASRTVRFAGGHDPITADALLIATGAEPKGLDVPGANLGGVFTLREVDDAIGIVRAASASPDVVVVGDGFIGLEAAASLTQRGARVTVVSRSGTPLKKLLGEDVAGVLARLHESKGVTLVTGEVAELTGDQVVAGVKLKDGTELPAAVVIAGIGVTPRTGLISGVELAEDGGVPVGTDLQVADGVWAAGDIATVDAIGRRVEHWRFAQQLGWVAADRMQGGDREADAVPYFWTNQFGARLDVIGQTSADADIRIDGSTEGDQPAFVAYYVESGEVTGVAASKRDPDVIRILEAWQRGERPSVADLPA
jgi:apoptosis-inducing factor 3